VAATLIYFLASLRHRKRSPFGDDVEVALDLEEPVKDQWPGLCNCFLHREDANEVIANTEVVTLRLDVGVHHLKVEVLSRLRLARDALLIKVKKPTKEAELRLLPLHLDRHEVGEMTAEVLDALLKAHHVGVDLPAEQDFHVVIGELRLEFSNSALGVARHPSESRKDAGL